MSRSSWYLIDYLYSTGWSKHRTSKQWLEAELLYRNIKKNLDVIPREIVDTFIKFKLEFDIIGVKAYPKSSIFSAELFGYSSSFKNEFPSDTAPSAGYEKLTSLLLTSYFGPL